MQGDPHAVAQGGILVQDRPKGRGRVNVGFGKVHPIALQFGKLQDILDHVMLPVRLPQDHAVIDSLLIRVRFHVVTQGFRQGFDGGDRRFQRMGDVGNVGLPQFVQFFVLADI